MNTTVGETKIRSWSAAVPIKIPDNIISSNFATEKSFIPSYEREVRPCIEQLLTNEYQRIWWQEKEAWDKKRVAKTGTKTLLQRTVIRRKPPTSKAVILKLQQEKLKKAKSKKNVKTPRKLRKDEKKDEDQVPEHVEEANIPEKPE